jgi:hypothetical protein
MTAKKRKPRKVVVWAVVVKSGAVYKALYKHPSEPNPEREARSLARAWTASDSRPFRVVRCEGVLK